MARAAAGLVALRAEGRSHHSDLERRVMRASLYGHEADASGTVAWKPEGETSGMVIGSTRTTTWPCQRVQGAGMLVTWIRVSESVGPWGKTSVPKVEKERGMAFSSVGG